MDSILKVFTRCMAIAVMATPFCVFGSIDMPQRERLLSGLKFDFSHPAAQFKAAVDAKVEQAQQKKAASTKGWQIFSMVCKGLGIALLAAVCVAAVVVTGGIILELGWPLVVEMFVAYPAVVSVLGLFALGGLVCMPFCAYGLGLSAYQDFVDYRADAHVASEPTFRSKS